MKIDGVKDVYRIPYRAVYLTYGLILLTGVVWIFHPFLLHWLSETDAAMQNAFMFNFLINTGLFGLLLLILYINNLIKNHLPHIRNKGLAWIVWFRMPALAFFTFLLGRH